MVNEQENGLKGQDNLAQGKRSGALGWRADRKIVRAVKFLKEKILFRTRGMSFCFREMMLSHSVRNNGVALISIFARTVFLLHPIPRAAFRFVPPETLPWADRYWSFRPEKSRPGSYYSDGIYSAHIDDYGNDN